MANHEKQRRQAAEKAAAEHKEYLSKWDANMPSRLKSASKAPHATKEVPPVPQGTPAPKIAPAGCEAIPSASTGADKAVAAANTTATAATKSAQSRSGATKAAKPPKRPPPATTPKPAASSASQARTERLKAMQEEIDAISEGLAAISARLDVQLTMLDNQRSMITGLTDRHAEMESNALPAAELENAIGRQRRELSRVERRVDDNYANTNSSLKVLERHYCSLSERIAAHDKGIRWGAAAVGFLAITVLSTL